jgi:ketosteroid isomerase-like protein
MDDAETSDRMALRLLVEQYAWAADRRDAEAYAGAFTDDAVLATNRRDIVGREQLLGVVANLNRYTVTMHLVGNHEVTFGADGDSATGSTYCVAQHVRVDDSGTERVYVMNIRYDDRYVRVDGGWRMAHRTLNLLWDEDRPLRS